MEPFVPDADEELHPAAITAAVRASAGMKTRLRRMRDSRNL